MAYKFNPFTVNLDEVGGASGATWETITGDQSDVNISGFTNDSGFISGITGESIGDLSDVDLTGIADDKILKWSTDKFVVADAGGGGGGLWEATTGDDIYYNDGKVGIGTTAPSADLTIRNDGLGNVSSPSTTEYYGLLLENNEVSTGLRETSPYIVLKGHGWTGSADSITEHAIYSDPMTKNNPTFRVAVRKGGTGAWSNIMSIDSYRQWATPYLYTRWQNYENYRHGIRLAASSTATIDNDNWAPDLLYLSGAWDTDGAFARSMSWRLGNYPEAGNPPVNVFAFRSGWNTNDPNTEIMRLTWDGSDGKVGIGTTAPSEKLDVNGNVKVDGDIYTDGRITGNAFYGDGSTLTGVATPAGIDGDIQFYDTGVLTANTRNVFKWIDDAVDDALVLGPYTDTKDSRLILKQGGVGSNVSGFRQYGVAYAVNGSANITIDPIYVDLRPGDIIWVYDSGTDTDYPMEIASGSGTSWVMTEAWAYTTTTNFGGMGKDFITAYNGIDEQVFKVYSNGDVQPHNYISQDGSEGISETINIEDVNNVTHTMVFKNGILTSYSNDA